MQYTTQEKTDALNRLATGRRCLDAAVVRVLNDERPAQPDALPETGGEPVPVRFATDADVGRWAITCRSAYDTCRGRLDAIRRFYEFSPEATGDSPGTLKSARFPLLAAGVLSAIGRSAVGRRAQPAEPVRRLLRDQLAEHRNESNLRHTQIVRRLDAMEAALDADTARIVRLEHAVEAAASHDDLKRIHAHRQGD